MEEWKDIVGFEGKYRVSNTGKIYSVLNDQFIKPTKVRSGHLTVPLALGKRTKYYRPQLGKLVGHAFLPPKPEWATMIDHIDGDPENNHISNLRWSNATLNMANTGGRTNMGGKPTSSKYRGVSLRNGKWEARVRSQNTTHYLGRFTKEIDAAKAYDAKALELWGEHARMNV